MIHAAKTKSLVGASVTLRLLQASFVFAVIGFAWMRFSENTVDNDLWGHVLYGQRYWLHQQVRGMEMLSWTAEGFNIINHEYLAEIVMGWVHRIGGGTGLWVYMVTMGVTTVGLAFHAAQGDKGRYRWAALALFAASANFIAVGFSVRPQLFTNLALVVELILLRQLAAGHLRRGLLIPLLIGLWINAHGGVLAGLVVFFIMVATETCHSLWPWEFGWDSPRLPPKNLRAYWTLFILAASSLLLNPWGYKLILWNVSAIRLPRPQILEWHPLEPSFAHAPFYFVVIITLLSWIFSRQPRKAWEAASLVVLAVMGVLHQRHVPLFGLANLVLSSRHLDDALRRSTSHARNLISTFSTPIVQISVSFILLIGCGASFFASFSAPKTHPFTMEVEKDLYPVTAVEFIQLHRLFGKTITFFDWGQQNIWELPLNPVSFDGRFDTGYPSTVIAAHWEFYSGRALRPEVNWAEAELALLPTGSGGANLLVHEGWRIIYRDPLASILVPAHGRHAGFRAGQPPIQLTNEAIQGRASFPDSPALLATASAPR